MEKDRSKTILDPLTTKEQKEVINRAKGVLQATVDAIRYDRGLPVQDLIDLNRDIKQCQA